VVPDFFPKFARLRNDLPLISYPGIAGGSPKDYFFDGSIGAYQLRDSANNVVAAYIYPAMRRGGRMIYAFDATQRPSAATPPTLLWKFGCPNASNDTGCTTSANDTSSPPYASKLGQTWSTPRVVRLMKGGQPCLCRIRRRL
jgi:type IV pilus assembly protein PilY1